MSLFGWDWGTVPAWFAGASFALAAGSFRSDHWRKSAEQARLIWATGASGSADGSRDENDPWQQSDTTVTVTNRSDHPVYRLQLLIIHRGGYSKSIYAQYEDMPSLEADEAIELYAKWPYIETHSKWVVFLDGFGTLWRREVGTAKLRKTGPIFRRHLKNAKNVTPEDE